MTQCRITDLIPVVKLKKVTIRDKVGDLSLFDNSAYVDPHLHPYDQNSLWQAVGSQTSSGLANAQTLWSSAMTEFTTTPIDELTIDVHLCAEDIIFNPNVEASQGAGGIIGSGLSGSAAFPVSNPIVQQYFPSLADDNGYVSYTEALPEEVVGSIVNNDLNFSQYFANREFTNHFKINLFYIKSDKTTDLGGQLIRLIEEIDRRFNIKANRSWGWRIQYFIKSLLVGHNVFAPPMTGAQGAYEFASNSAPAPWNAVAIQKYFFDLGIDDSAFFDWISNNMETIYSDDAQQFIIPTQLVFDEKSINDLVNEGYGRYNEDGNFIYSILPSDSNSKFANMPNPPDLSYDKSKGVLRIRESDVNVRNCAIYTFPEVSPDVLDVGLTQHYGMDPSFRLQHGGTVSSPSEVQVVFKNEFLAMQPIFSGFGTYQRILIDNKSVDQPGGITGQNTGIIQDFREIQRLSNLNHDFYANNFKVMLDTLTYKLNKPSGYEDNNFVSNLFSAFHEEYQDDQGKINKHLFNYFSFNILNYLRLRSTLAPIYQRLHQFSDPNNTGYNPAYKPILDDLLHRCNILSLRVYRKRVSNGYIASTDLDYRGQEEFTVNEREQMICHTSDSNLGGTNLPNIPALNPKAFIETAGTPVSMIRQLGLYFDNGTGEDAEYRRIRNVCFADTDIMTKSTGKYKYRVEIDVADHLPEKINELFYGTEMMLKGYDNLINFVENAKIPPDVSWALGGNYPTSGLSTNYFYVTNQIHPDLFDASTDSGVYYADLITEIESHKSDLRDLYLMIAGKNLYSMSMIDNLSFADLEEIYVVRDFIATFLRTVDSILGFSGSGRTKGVNSSPRNAAYPIGGSNTGNEGRFSRPKYNTLKYNFKEVIDMSPMQNLKYTIMGTRQVKSEVQGQTAGAYPNILRATQHATYGTARSPNYCTIKSLELRYQEEWRRINNDYVTAMPAATNVTTTSIVRDDPDTGYSLYTDLGVRQVIRPDIEEYNLYNWTNVGHRSKSMYITDVDRSLHDANSPNRFNVTQEFNHDAVELGNAMIGSYKTESQVTLSYTPVSTMNSFNRDNTFYKQKNFASFINDNLATTVTCNSENISILDSIDNVNDEESCAPDLAVIEGKTTPSLQFNETFVTSELVDSPTMLDVEVGKKSLQESTSLNAKEEDALCEATIDYVTSRALANMRGYNILRRPDFIQGNQYSKFDLDDYNSRMFINDSVKQHLSFQADLDPYSIVEQGGELSYLYQLNLILQLHRIYRIEYLGGFTIDMKPQWKPINFTNMKGLMYASPKGILCRIKLRNNTDLQIDNINTSLNLSALDEYFVLCTKSDIIDSNPSINILDLLKDHEGGV